MDNLIAGGSCQIAIDHSYTSLHWHHSHQHLSRSLLLQDYFHGDYSPDDDFPRNSTSSLPGLSNCCYCNSCFADYYSLADDDISVVGFG